MPSKVLLAFVFLIVATFSSANTEFWCDGGEQQSTLANSLNAFVLGTELTSWHYNYLWGSDECPCSWFGVDCTDSNTTVTLNLSDNSIYGTISPDFCADIYSNINLDNNELFSRIPSCIGEMEHLQSLKLRNNSLQGLLPESLGNLKKLVHLNVQDNELAGPFPNYIQCPNQFFPSKVKLEFSDNLFWCPTPNWCKSPPTGNGECTKCEEEPSSACTNLNAVACDAIIGCCYKSSWNAQCDDFVNKTTATCTPDNPAIVCDNYKPYTSPKDSSDVLSTVLWILFAVGIILVILAAGLFAVFMITLKKRQWSFREVKHQLIKVDSETYLMDPDDDIYQDEQPPRSSLDYDL